MISINSVIRDLSEMANRLWRERGETEKFDEDKFFTYGCHCFLDRKCRNSKKSLLKSTSEDQFGEPLKHGKGAPVDEIDRACKKVLNQVLSAFSSF